ncbi:TPA: phenylpyruvate tautomerase MIF-related protein [Mannheimia haemolytica]
MAFIHIQTNVGISKEVQKEISDVIGKAVSLISHQSADSILIVFDDNKAMYYQGNEPAVLVKFRAFGNENRTGYRAFSAQINQILHRTLHIASGRIFVEFADINAFGVGAFYAER